MVRRRNGGGDLDDGRNVHLVAKRQVVLVLLACRVF